MPSRSSSAAAREVGDRPDVVPQAEEEVAAGRAGDGAEQVLGEVDLLVAGEHGARAVDEPPLLGQLGGELGVGGVGWGGRCGSGSNASR